MIFFCRGSGVGLGGGLGNGLMDQWTNGPHHKLLHFQALEACFGPQTKVLLGSFFLKLSLSALFIRWKKLLGWFWHMHNMHTALPKSHHCCPFMISNQFALIQVLGFFGGHSAAQFQINFQLSEHMVRVSALDNWPRCLEYFFHFILILIIFVFVFVLFIIIFVFPGFVLVCSNCLMPAPPLSTLTAALSLIYLVWS